MKTKIIALALFTSTAAAVGLYPALQNPNNVDAIAAVQQQINDHPKIDVVFVLDTTGSMSGLINAAKEKIWSIASTMASAQPAPEIRMGLVAYRDRGDQYVTRIIDLSPDLDSMYATLMDFQANGGGDGPESVNQALDDAIRQISWSQEQDTYKAIFLMGDAPPHMDYADDVKYPQSLTAASDKGIVVNAVQCGTSPATAREWQHIAQLGKGRYFQVEQAGSAIAIATPFDDKLARLSRELDETRLYYGNEKEKAAQKTKLDAASKLHSEASTASQARRATFNSTRSGKTNYLGKKELVDDVASGRISLLDIDPEQLPEALQSMAPQEQEALIRKKAEERNELKQHVRQLAEQRSDFLARKVAENGGAGDSLDEKIYRAVREQAEAKGLRYEDDSADC